MVKTFGFWFYYIFDRKQEKKNTQTMPINQYMHTSDMVIDRNTSSFASSSYWIGLVRMASIMIFFFGMCKFHSSTFNEIRLRRTINLKQQKKDTIRNEICLLHQTLWEEKQKMPAYYSILAFIILCVSIIITMMMMMMESFHIHSYWVQTLFFIRFYSTVKFAPWTAGIAAVKRERERSRVWEILVRIYMLCAFQ